MIGNILSGFVASSTSWKWVFGVLAILAACISVAGSLTIPPHRAPETPTTIRLRDQLDLPGAFLSTFGLGILLVVLSTGNEVGWATPWVPPLIVVGVALVTVFIFWERRLEAGNHCPPLLRVSLFQSREFSISMAVMCMLFSSFNGFLVYATMFFQDYQCVSIARTCQCHRAVSPCHCLHKALKLLALFGSFFLTHKKGI